MGVGKRGVEQIGKARNIIKASPAFWRWHKQMLSRWRRRTEKRDPENAPRRRREEYSGWAD